MKATRHVNLFSYEMSPRFRGTTPSLTKHEDVKREFSINVWDFRCSGS